jgi:hypothetical protein
MGKYMVKLSIGFGSLAIAQLSHNGEIRMSIGPTGLDLLFESLIQFGFGGWKSVRSNVWCAQATPYQLMTRHRFWMGLPAESAEPNVCMISVRDLVASEIGSDLHSAAKHLLVRGQEILTFQDLEGLKDIRNYDDLCRSLETKLPVRINAR